MTRASMKSVVAAAAFALASTAPFSAHAICEQVGTAVTHFQLPDQSILIVAPNTFDGVFYFCGIFNVRLEAAAIAAASTKSRVVVQGDAGSCPATGQPFRYIGTCNLIGMNP
jgi:hypothetical protein